MKSAKILTALTAVLLVTTTAAPAAEMFNRIASFPVAQQSGGGGIVG
jgi:hypothetical protein